MGHLTLTMRVSYDNARKPGFVTLSGPFGTLEDGMRYKWATLQVANRDEMNNKLKEEATCLLTIHECETLAKQLMDMAVYLRAEEC